MFVYVISIRSDPFGICAALKSNMKVKRSHIPEIESFPVVKKGEKVQFFKVDEKYPRWFVGITSEGVEGYFPLKRFERIENGNAAIALGDYDSTELRVNEGDEATIVEEYGGWVLVEADGNRGWIPASCFDI